MRAIPLCQCPVGSVVRLHGLDVYATVISIGVGSVTVRPGNGTTQTNWSRGTMVVVMAEAPESPAPALKTTAPTKPRTEAPEAPAKPRKRLKLATNAEAPAEAPEAPAKPKGGGKDIFGVKLGSAAALANEILLELKKDVTPEMCVKKNRTLVVSNVRSHFKRMANDGLINMRSEGSGRAAVLYFSIKGVK